MAITDPKAIEYSNRFLRPAADQLARFYYKTVALNDLWDALGGTTDDKWALPHVKEAVFKLAQRATFTYKQLKEAHVRWTGESIGAVIPNDAGEEIWDAHDGSGQDPTRPPITGQDAFRVKQRTEEWINFMEAAQFLTDGNVTNARDFLTWEAYVRVNQGRATADPAGDWGWKVAKDLAELIRTNYETTNPGHINHILAVAVNAGE